MKPLSDFLRAKIDLLRKTMGNNAEPTWELDVYRDRDKMLGLIDGEQITTSSNDDYPAVAQSDDQVYTVVFQRGGTLYEMESGTTNRPKVNWDTPTSLFSGSRPDLDYDGEFTTGGAFITGDLMMVYENPTGSIKFRRKTGSSWDSAVSVASGNTPAICRAWADPPEVGPIDNGIIVFYASSGQLCYRESFDNGESWETEVEIDDPPGGTKRNPHICRLSDYTLGIVYEYDNGITSDAYFLKTSRTYVSIASPDETIRMNLGSFRHYSFTALYLDYGQQGDGSETLTPVLGSFRQHTWDAVEPDEGIEETLTPVLGSFRQIAFTGANP